MLKNSFVPLKHCWLHQISKKCLVFYDLLKGFRIMMAAILNKDEQFKTMRQKYHYVLREGPGVSVHSETKTLKIGVLRRACLHYVLCMS